MENGVKLYLESEDRATIPYVEINSDSLEPTHIYKIAEGQALKVTAVPGINSFNTTYDFKYWNDGTKIPDAPIFLKMDFHK